MYDAVCFCHKYSTVHLDIKLENFLVHDNIVKLTEILFFVNLLI